MKKLFIFPIILFVFLFSGDEKKNQKEIVIIFIYTESVAVPDTTPRIYNPESTYSSKDSLIYEAQRKICEHILKRAIAYGYLPDTATVDNVTYGLVMKMIQDDMFKYYDPDGNDIKDDIEKIKPSKPTIKI